MKHLGFCFLLILTACSASSISENKIEEKVTLNINKAIIENDFRLYSMGGRVPNFPGINADELDILITKCGKRIMENTSDFIKRDEDLKAREIAFLYAKKYNKKMKSACIKQN